MTDINFSADMVGVKTLAQQGKSVMQADGENVIGGFEDLILQLLANNLTIDTTQLVENTVDTSKTDESEIKDVQSLLNEMILSGMINSDAQIVNIINSEEIINNLSAEDIAVVLDNISGGQQVIKSNTNDTADAADIIGNIGSDENSEFADLVQQISDVKEDTTVAWNVAEYSEVSENANESNETMQFDNAVTEENVPFAEGKKEDVQSDFISTEDMLLMRSGNKINFETSKIAFKVADTPVNIQSPNAAADLADKILMRFDENQFEVELYPKNLGKITVNLTVEDGIVHVAMNSNNSKVNEFLASQSANIQNIVEKNTQYNAIVKVDDSQEMYQRHERDNAQHGADENQKNRQQEHMQNMYRRDIQHTEDFLSMLNITI